MFGYRGLAIAWLTILVLALGGALALQGLGPPPARRVAEAPAAAPAAPPVAAEHPLAPTAAPVAFGPPAPEPPRQTTPATIEPPAPGSPIQPPVAAMLEPASGTAPAGLPRIGPDGRKPWQVYAAGTPPDDGRPKVAVLLGGIGLSESDSEDAARALPAAISFVVSPYTAKPDRLLGDLRTRGHEILLAIPTESQDFPTDDAGTQSLLTSAPPAQNAKRLEWALSRFAGYVGVTNAADGLLGERFAKSPQMGALLQVIAQRGLLYIDTGPARPPASPRALVARGIDVQIDEPAVRPEIEARLARLEQIARTRGSAVGLASLPRPVTIEALAAWTAALSGRGISLVPVSAAAAPSERAP